MPDYLISATVLVLAYSVRGMTGFGSTMLAVPLLALLHPLHVVVPAVVALDVLASFILAGHDFRAIRKVEIARILPFGIIGALLGTAAFTRYPSPIVLPVIGAAAVLFGIRFRWWPPRSASIPALWAVPAGLIGSSSGSLFGMPYMVYLAQRVMDKTGLRATFSSLLVLDGGLRVALMASAGMVTREVEMAVSLGLLPMAAGLYLGNRVHQAVSAEVLLNIVAWSLIAGGLYLILL